MKSYLKHTVLFILYHPLSYLAGGLIAGITCTILSAIFETNREPIQNIVQPILITIVPLIFLVYFFQRDAYEYRRFSPLMIIGSSIPFFVFQITRILKRDLGILFVGGVGVITNALFPDTEYIEHFVLVQIGLQLLIYLPSYLLASYVGYRRRMREIQEMKHEHQEKVK